MSILQWHFSSFLLICCISIVKNQDMKFKTQFWLKLGNLHNEIKDKFNREIEEKDEHECLQHSTEMVANTTAYNFIYYTGHYFNKMGNEKMCQNETEIYFDEFSKSNITYRKYKYFILLFTRNITEDQYTYQYEEEMELFLSLNKSDVGLCLLSECEKFINDVSDREKNGNFFEYLENVYDIKNLEVIYIKDEEKFSKFGIISFSIVFFYIVIRLFLPLLISCFIASEDEDNLSLTKGIEEDLNKLFKKKDAKKGEEDENALFNESGLQNEEKENSDEEDRRKEENRPQLQSIQENEEELKERDEDDSRDSKISSNSLFDKSGETSGIQNLEKYMTPANKNAAQNQNQNQNQIAARISSKTKNSTISIPFKVKFNEFMVSLNDNMLANISLRVLLTKKTKIYNSMSLEPLNGVRTIVVLFFTFDRLYNLFFNSPANSPGTPDFFRTANFSLIKFASYSPYAWLYLDSFIFAYKLLKYTKNDTSWVSFLIFYLRMIPKALTFFILFYLVYYNGNNIAMVLGKTTLFEQVYQNDYAQYECMSKPSLIFIPFYLGYSASNLVEYEVCFSFVYLFLNEMISFSVILIMMYVLYKLKSKLAEWIVFGLFMINLLLSFVSYAFSKFSSKYILTYILGENLIVMRPHLMINIFFFGTIGGVIYYNYTESMTEIETVLNSTYTPFSFCKSIMTFMISQKIFLKYISGFISIVIILSLCFTYFIASKVLLKDESKVLVDFNIWLKLIYVYEGPLFTCCFSVLLINLLFSEDKSRIKSLLGSSLFFWFDRIAFCSVCLMEFIIIIIYTLFDVSGTYWNYLFLGYLTAFVFGMIVFFAMLSTILVEVPLRFIFISLFRIRNRNRSNSAASSQKIINT